MNFATTYDHDGVPLKLTGERDADECVIASVKAADSQIELIDIFPVPTLLSMAERVDAQLAREARQQNAEARYDSRRMAYELDRLARH